MPGLARVTTGSAQTAMQSTPTTKILALNVTDPAAAHEMLEQLPLGQAHLMSFELIRSARSRRFVS